MAAGIIVTYLLSRVQVRLQEESPEVIKEQVSQLEPELRKQVQARSYGARSNLIDAPRRELDLDITPRLGGVRDPHLVFALSQLVEFIANSFTRLMLASVAVIGQMARNVANGGRR